MTRISTPAGLSVSGVALALSLVAWSGGAGAAGQGKTAKAGVASTPTTEAVQAQMTELLARVRQLEQSNQELARQVRELSAAGGAARGPAQEQARLQQLEQQQQALQQQVKDMERPHEPAGVAPAVAVPQTGWSIEGSLTSVAQQVNAHGAERGRQSSAVNYRGDVLGALSMGHVGDAQSSLHGHLRFGQGTGLALRPTYSSTANSTAFEAAAGADDSYAIVAEAYYQLNWPLSAQGDDRQHLEFTAGKMDFFGFFDQNAVAADESGQFLNNAFVHNPLLDSGGDVAADAYGFAPGLKLSYQRSQAFSSLGVSLGVFGSGGAANFGGAGGKPMVIGQIDWVPMKTDHEALATYRAYAWTNGRTTDLLGHEQRHSGWGLSLDQRLTVDWRVFGRYGRRTSGDGAFDQALTLGLEQAGRLWGREHDTLGLALGWLKTDASWRDATADGSLTGYAATGQEQIAELYYRIRLNDHLHLTPDYQFVQRAGGDGAAPRVHVLGLRATLGF